MLKYFNLSGFQQSSVIGDLKQFLLATRKESKGSKPRPAPLTARQTIALVHQLAMAMEHISNHRTVHRDLAARNCLISSDLSLKVSFSALCKDTYAKEYFKHRNQVNMFCAVKSQPYFRTTISD
ncbi:hypothetical protein LSTR_LSTR016625 [Laodelphax striatellus]|uniref:Protein kinase domain-containing protein n=1 Tax=Laodelphax striatellus TaxID=195883 RepID=A0A482XF72_LAOST|nr:hypothetical protein LSTR_LSTR016625 [Laodelphax striatellus]